MNITVIGLGYVGLVNAVLLASYDHKVIGLDIDKEKVFLLKDGVSTIEEPNLQTLLTESKNNLRFTTNYSDAIRPNNIFFLCIPTPFDEEKNETDLTVLHEVLDQIATHCTQNSYIIIRSTIPVGVTRKAKQYLETKTAYRFEFIYFPDFISEGRAVYDYLNPSRLVLGVENKSAVEFAKSLTSIVVRQNTPVLITTYENAEMIKYASNAYLSTKVGFINQISKICEKTGADIDKVAFGMGLDPRISPSFLQTGAGVGGHCLSDDTKSFAALLEENGVDNTFIKEFIKLNAEQPNVILDKIFTKYKSITNFNVAVLGCAYKAGTDDVRKSPAIPIVKTLLEKGAMVQLYDPLAEDNFHKVFSRYTRIKYCDYATDALKKADFAVILTDIKEFKDLTSEDFISNMSDAVVFDGRNTYTLDHLAGVEYHSIGRKSIYRKR